MKHVQKMKPWKFILKDSNISGTVIYFVGIHVVCAGAEAVSSSSRPRVYSELWLWK